MFLLPVFLSIDYFHISPRSLTMFDQVMVNIGFLFLI